MWEKEWLKYTQHRQITVHAAKTALYCIYFNGLSFNNSSVGWNHIKYTHFLFFICLMSSPSLRVKVRFTLLSDERNWDLSLDLTSCVFDYTKFDPNYIFYWPECATCMCTVIKFFGLDFLFNIVSNIIVLI